MKVNLTNYGDNHLELNATQLEATIISKEDASELLGNLLNVVDGLRDYIKTKQT